MKNRAVLLALSVGVLAACGAREHTPNLQAPTGEDAAGDVPVAAAPEIQSSMMGLELSDSPSGISLLDAGIQDDLTGLSPPKFALHCNTAAKTLEVVAPARQLGAYAVAGPAEFVVSGEVFGGEAVLVDGGVAGVSLTLPLTPDLLAAIATTVSARVIIGDGFAESHDDTTGAFPGFAGQCSLQSGVPFPPR